MPPLDTGAEFVTFLRQYRAQILAIWERKVRELPPAANLDHQALIDHLPTILDDIADAAEAALAGERPPPLHSDPDRHAVVRLQQGYHLGHVVTEYSLLRETILELSQQLAQTYPEELRVFNRVLDRALQQAVHRYAEARHRLLVAVDRISMLAYTEHQTEDDLLRSLLQVMVESAEEVDEVTILMRYGDRLYARQAVGVTADNSANHSIAVGEGFAGTIVARGEPLLIRSAETDPLVKADFLREHQIKALYGVPLLDGKEIIGVAHMGSVTAYEFVDEDLLLFRAMANRASQLLTETRLKAQLRTQHQELRLTLRAAGLGTFLLDLERDLVKWDERTRAIFGVSESEHITFDRFLSLVVAADRHTVDEAARNALASGTDYQLRYCVRRPDGEARHVAMLGGVIIGADQRRQLLGVVHDRTDDDRAERERELFLAALGHDLRSPLQAILMGMQLLMRSPGLPEPALRTVERAARSTDRMTKLIEHLLDFARVRAGNPITLHPRRADLVDLWHQVIDEIALGARGRNVELRVLTSTFGEWDPERLLRVFENLAWNAVHYGDPTQPITVTLSGDAQRIVCDVHNFGPVIPRDLLPVLFEPFRRGKRTGRGLGLGLFIARHIVVAHGGDIEATSSPDEGTRFRVRLPRSAPHAPEGAPSKE